MEIERPLLRDWWTAWAVHTKFRRKPHSEHIASVFALAHLALLLRTNRLGSVVEFGAGIGTVTYLLLSALPGDAKIHSVEPQPFCRDRLRANIPPDMLARLALYDEAPPLPGVDLAIIDGRSPADASFLRPGTLVFFEGSRRNARADLQTALKAQGLTVTCYERRNGSRIKLAPTRFGFRRPVLAPRKGCWIGEVVVSCPAATPPAPSSIGAAENQRPYVANAEAHSSRSSGTAA